MGTGTFKNINSFGKTKGSTLNSIIIDEDKYNMNSIKVDIYIKLLTQLIYNTKQNKKKLDIYKILALVLYFLYIQYKINPNKVLYNFIEQMKLDLFQNKEKSSIYVEFINKYKNQFFEEEEAFKIAKIYTFKTNIEEVINAFKNVDLDNWKKAI